MNRSLLNRLPDILLLARQRARDLTRAPAQGPVPTPPPWPAAGSAAITGDRQVTLLCGDELSVLTGLLEGQSPDGPLGGRVALIWLAGFTQPSADTQGDALSPVQHQTRLLIDLSTHLFLARELLHPKGLLALPAQPDPDRCHERVLRTIFGHACRVGDRTRHPLRTQAYLAGRQGCPDVLRPDEPSLLGQLARAFTGPGDWVLVLGASADGEESGEAAALDRRWVLVQADQTRFGRLRERVLAQHTATTGMGRRVRETLSEWPAASRRVFLAN